MLRFFRTAAKKALTLGITAALTVSALPALPQISAADTVLTVGKNGTYRTVGEAVQAAAALNPGGEHNRVTVSIEPGTYREQLLINTPYLSFVNSNPEGGEVLLTWYYGIGYQYYSAASSGYYSASDAAARSKKGKAQRWGTAVRLQSGAKYFRAEHITFENSFNRYMTSEEIADGVEPTGESITVQRTANLDVRAKSSTERAAALCVEADCCEFYQCSFLSSQDTLYTEKPSYFRECKIQGNTDFIFGSGDVVFDRCELCFGGYSNQAAGGYITAARQQTLGYLFWECNVTAAQGMQVSSGYFGRPWRDTAHVLFCNTVLQYESIISGAGWTKMSDVEPTQATFREFGTKTASGAAVNTGSRVYGTVLSSCNVTREDYFGSWTPYFYNFTVSTTLSGVKIQENQGFVLRNADSGLWLCADASGKVTLGSRDKAAVFMVYQPTDGYNTLELTEDDRHLAVAGGSAENGAAVTAEKNGSGGNGQFKFVRAGQSRYLISTGASADACCLGVSGGSAAAGETVVQAALTGEDDQQWILEMDGRLLTGLRVLDEERAELWRTMRHAEDGVLVYFDRDVTFRNLPEALTDSETVCPACDSKYASGTLAEFSVKVPATVYIGMDERVDPLPSWLSDWQQTDLQFSSTGEVDYRCYAKDVNPGETVTLGANGQSSYCVQYTVFVQAKQTAEETTSYFETGTTTHRQTEETTSYYETGTTSRSQTEETTFSSAETRHLAGDTDCSGEVDLRDAVLLAKAAAGLESLSSAGRRNADCDGDGSIGNGDLKQLLMYLSGAIDRILA